MVLSCISLMSSHVEQFFVVCGHLYVFFGEMSVHVFCLFLDGVICSLGVEFGKFFIDFGYSPFICMSFAHIFPHSVGRLWFC